MPGVRLRCHFHNTRNTGIANAFAAVEAGAVALDASIGGVGGCPFAPAATGNISTEDLLYMLDRSGIQTGVSLTAMIETARWLQEQLGRPIPGMLMKAGPFPKARRRKPVGILMSYRLGVDVGGTFTDLLLVNESTGGIWSAKVPSTPADQSIGVLNGIARVCERAGIAPKQIDHVMHGTTVATNTVLTGTGARCGLVTTVGYRQVLQIARSYVPGGLGGWVIYNKSLPLAPLSCTVEAHERVSAKGEIVTPLDEARLRESLRELRKKNIEALTVSLINSFANDRHEKRIKADRRRRAARHPGLAVIRSRSRDAGIRAHSHDCRQLLCSPRVSRYVRNLTTKLQEVTDEIKLHILRSDGGLASAASSEEFPVNLLMSGPAGGVTGALWVALQAGFPNLLTLDVGGTSTDVALIQDGEPRLRRETTVGDVTVRASSVDIRTVGAGGGSIAHVPQLTKALRVGPQSAGADPGPAAYNKGGTEPTVTDANIVLGYMPEMQKLGGDMTLDRKAAAHGGPENRRCAEPLARGRGARHLQHRQRKHDGRAAPRVRGARL